MRELIFLGTSAMIPTAKRNHTSIFLRYLNYGLLFDCGEGTQRQFRLAKISPTKITHIFISHLHGDHILGLPGLLQTLQASEYTKQLTIYGPRKLSQYLKDMAKYFDFGDLKLSVKPVHHGIILTEENFVVKAFKLKHPGGAFGFRFIEKDKRKIKPEFINKLPGPLLGKLQKGVSVVYKNRKITPKEATFVKPGVSISIVLDTLFFEELINYVKNSTILVVDSTLTSNFLEKAKEFGHMTAEQAAMLAKKAKVKQLILTHISQRYKTSQPLLREAKKIFPNTIVAKDLLKITY